LVAIAAGGIVCSIGEVPVVAPLGANDAIAWVNCAVRLLGAAPTGSAAMPLSCAPGGALPPPADTPLIDHSRPT